MKILEEVDEINISPEDQFDESELNIPSRTEIISMKEFFGTEANLVTTEDIQTKVREMLVPMALNTYKSLLSSTDLKVRKSAADAIMEISGLKGGANFQSKTGGLGGVTFNLMGAERKNLMGAFGEVIKGELVEELEIN